MDKKYTQSEVNAALSIGSKTKPQGSALVLVLWIIFFWPVAIYYAATRSFGVQVAYVQNIIQQAQQTSDSKDDKEAK